MSSTVSNSSMHRVQSGPASMKSEGLWILIQANWTIMNLEVLVGLLMGLVLANQAELVS